MHKPSWTQVEEVFIKAIEMSDDERSAYLDQLIQQNPELGEQVGRLIESSDPKEDILENRFSIKEGPWMTKVVEALAEDDDDDSPLFPDCPNHFEVVKKLGEGGMGEVYLARQRNLLQREVALKVIRYWEYSARRHELFEAEQSLLAQMNHQNIARIYESGATSDGRPFFSMELIPESQNLIEHCCFGEPITLRNALELYLQACEGMIHAHQRGVIHRDVKPSNILVSLQDDTPLVKIIDFGIARSLSESDSGSPIMDVRMGTPRYMSPEQTVDHGVVDIRTDIYSLGLVLYELLTGSGPFDERFEEEPLEGQLRYIKEMEPLDICTRLAQSDGLDELAKRRGMKPEALIKALSGDLSYITKRAMAKGQEDRYQTVNELAEDIRCYLENRPIPGRKAGAGYHLKKFYKRRKALSITAVGLFIALIMAIVIYVDGVIKIQQQEIKTAEFEVSEQATRSVMKWFLSQTHPNKLGPRATLAEALDSSVLELTAYFEEKPLKEAPFQAMFGRALMDTGRYQKAREHLGRSRQLYLEQSEFYEAVEVGEEIVWCFALQGEFAESNVLLDILETEINQHQLGQEAAIILQMGRAYLSLYDGDAKAAQEIYESVCETLFSTLSDTHPMSLRARLGLALSHNDLRNDEEALRQLAILRDIHTSTESVGLDQILRTNQAYIVTLINTNRTEEAQAVIDESYPLIEGWYDQIDRLRFDHLQAEIYLEKRLYEQAIELYQQVLAGREELLSPNSIETLDTRTNLGKAFSDQGRDLEAIEHYRAAIKIHRNNGTLKKSTAMTTMNNLGNSLKKVERYEEAVAVLSETWEKRKEVNGPKSHGTLVVMCTLGETYMAMGNYERAIAHFEDLLPLGKETNNQYYPLFRGFHAKAVALSGDAVRARSLLSAIKSEYNESYRHWRLLDEAIKEAEAALNDSGV